MVLLVAHKLRQVMEMPLMLLAGFMVFCTNQTFQVQIWIGLVECDEGAPPAEPNPNDGVEQGHIQEKSTPGKRT